jgi:hypothetical protein
MLAAIVLHCRLQVQLQSRLQVWRLQAATRLQLLLFVWPQESRAGRENWCTGVIWLFNMLNPFVKFSRAREALFAWIVEIYKRVAIAIATAGCNSCNQLHAKLHALLHADCKPVASELQ